MGDRGNICVKNTESNEKEIWFYSHWYGSEMKRIVADALNRGKNRWGDEPYLNRIIFSELIQHHVLDETGFGIYTEECDPNHPAIYVHHNEREVLVNEKTWSFDEFIDKFKTEQKE